MYKIICTSDARVNRRHKIYEIYFYEKPNVVMLDIDLKKILPHGKYIFDMMELEDV